jgi:AcrR family transcriptional regulator
MFGPLTRAHSAGGVRDREAYFAAAYQLLAEGGCQAVTMGALCERLHVTRGSFYYHFANMPTFVVALAQRWRIGVLQWVEACEAESHPLRRYELVVNSSPQFVAGGDAAFRAWAQQQPEVAAALAEIHVAADALALRILAEILGDLELARLLQTLATCGFYGLSLRVDRDLDLGRYLALARESARRSVGVETELVDGGRGPQFRFLDGVEPELPASPPLRLPAAQARLREDLPTAGVPGAERESRRTYLIAARELLAEQGSDGLTVEALCRRLGVTKGSFYWHFDGMSALVEALATQWEQGHRSRLAAADHEPQPPARLGRLLDELLQVPDPAAGAIRAWAHTEPVLGDAVRRIDRMRRDSFASAIRDATADPAAEEMAELMLGLTIGLQESPLVLDADTTIRVALGFATRYLRLDATVNVVDSRPILRIPRLRSARPHAES